MQLYSKVIKNNNFNIDEELLNNENFVDLLGLCSLSLYINDIIVNPEFKLIFFIDYLANKSKGLENITVKNYKLLDCKQSEECKIFFNFAKLFPKYTTCINKDKFKIHNYNKELFSKNNNTDKYENCSFFNYAIDNDFFELFNET